MKRTNTNAGGTSLTLEHLEEAYNRMCGLIEGPKLPKKMYPKDDDVLTDVCKKMVVRINKIIEYLEYRG